MSLLPWNVLNELSVIALIKMLDSYHLNFPDFMMISTRLSSASP